MVVTVVSWKLFNRLAGRGTGTLIVRAHRGVVAYRGRSRGRNGCDAEAGAGAGVAVPKQAEAYVGTDEGFTVN